MKCSSFYTILLGAAIFSLNHLTGFSLLSHRVFNIKKRLMLVNSPGSSPGTSPNHRCLSDGWALSVESGPINEKINFEPTLPASPSSAAVPLVAWRGLVLLVCIIWSTNFAVIKMIQSQDIPGFDPSMYAAMRFSIAALILSPRTLGCWNNIDMLKGSLLVGFCKFMGYYGQSLGMLTSSADKSAFICSMNVVWVAIVSSFLYKRFKVQTWVSVALAVVGIAFLELEGSAPPVIGDAWLLLQPIGFGSSYLLLERLMTSKADGEVNEPSSMNAGAVTAFSLMTVAVTSIFWAISQGHSLDDVQSIVVNPAVMMGLVYTGVVTTAGAIWLQSIAFKKVPASDVSIILTMEPIFAAGFAAVLLGESISFNDIIGGILVLSGCLSNELNLVDKLTTKYRFQMDQWKNGKKDSQIE